VTIAIITTSAEILRITPPKFPQECSTGTLHSLPEVLMPEPTLSLGAHLLLWVFPLILAVLVVVESLVGGRRGEGGA
jgi:hypothetical protein